MKKIWVFCYCRNEERMMPFFLRHYAAIADRILIFDDGSTDNTRKIVSNEPRALLFNWPMESGMNEEHFLQFSQTQYKVARGLADWVIWADADEFMWSANIQAVLGKCDEQGIDIVQCLGFNMLGPGGPPKNDGRSQIWELHNQGALAPIYDKPILFRPGTDMKWTRGRHAIENMPGAKISPQPMANLLHYRYMGYDYTAKRNANNYDRVNDKGVAWSCAPDFDGEHSAAWARDAVVHAFNVFSKTV